MEQQASKVGGPAASVCWAAGVWQTGVEQAPDLLIVTRSLNSHTSGCWAVGEVGGVEAHEVNLPCCLVGPAASGCWAAGGGGTGTWFPHCRALNSHEQPEMVLLLVTSCRWLQRWRSLPAKSHIRYPAAATHLLHVIHDSRLHVIDLLYIIAASAAVSLS
jgi:hypothetical protein